jgi:hypothetical protein
MTITAIKLKQRAGFITLMALGVPSVSKVILYSERDEAVSEITAAVDLLIQDRE